MIGTATLPPAADCSARGTKPRHAGPRSARVAGIVATMVLAAGTAPPPAAVAAGAAARPRPAPDGDAPGVRVPAAALAWLADRLQPAPVDQQAGDIDYVEFRFGSDEYEVDVGRPSQYARLQSWARTGGAHWTRVLRETGGVAVCDVAWQDAIEYAGHAPAWFDIPPADPAALERFLLTNPYPPLRGDTAELYLLFRISWLAQEHVPTLRQRRAILHMLAWHPNLAVQVGTRDDAGRMTITVSTAGIEHDPALRYLPVKPVRRVLVFDAATGMLLTETLYGEPAVLVAGSRAIPHPRGSGVLEWIVFVDRRHLRDPTAPTLGCPLGPHRSSSL